MILCSVFLRAVIFPDWSFVRLRVAPGNTKRKEKRGKEKKIEPRILISYVHQSVARATKKVLAAIIRALPGGNYEQSDANE